jgi:hypothetical protein
MPTLDSYQFTVGRPINMDEAIYMLSPMDTPLLGGSDGDGVPILGKQTVDQTIFYWMEEEALLPSSTMAANVLIGATTFTVPAGHGQRFLVGDLLRVLKTGVDETMRVTAVNYTTDTLTVTRAFAGTAIAYASGDPFVSIGQALAEGSAPGESRQIGRVQDFNYTQIAGPLKASITRTEEGTAKYGVASERAKQIMLRIQEATITREQTLLYGVRTNNTTTKLRSSGGLTSFLTQNVDAVAGQLSVAKIEALMALCYARGGIPTVGVFNPAALGGLNDLANTSRVRQEVMDTVRGRAPVTLVATEYGDMPIVRHRWLNLKDGLLIKPEGLTRRVFDELTMTPMAKIADSTDDMIVGEEGLEVKGQAHMARFSELTA